MIRSLSQSGIVLAALMLLASCRAETDRALYGAGDFGTSQLTNGSESSLLVDCTVRLDQIEDGEWVEREERLIDRCRLFRPLPPPIPFPLPVPLDPTAVDPIFLDPVDAGLTLVVPSTVASTAAALSFDAQLDFLSLEGIEEPESVPVGPGGALRTGFHAPTDPGRWRIRYQVGLDCGDAAVAIEECLTEDSVETPAFGVEAFCPVEECTEQPPICHDDVFLGLRPGVRGPVGLEPSDLTIAPFPFPFPLPGPACRRDNDTRMCRWVCDDATPIPPPRPY